MSKEPKTPSPSVSVVVVSYNRLAMLRRAIDSALGQTFAPSEIIVIDNCSPDFDIFEALSDYGARIKVIRNTGNNGCGDARNVGVKLAMGEFVAFLDDDDYWKPNKLERQMAAIGNAVMVTCGQEFTPRAGFNVRQINSITPDMLRIHNPICGPSTFVCRRSLFQQVEFDPRLKYAEDWDFLVRTLSVGEVAYVAEPLLYYTVDETGKSMTSAGRNRSWEEIQYRFAAADKHRQFMGESNYRVRCASITLHHLLSRRDKITFIARAVQKAGLRATGRVLWSKLTARTAR